ncbi:energy coupling factor transporter S component ThiW [Cytobacillus firmus]|uniref:energy coupling factor transporter S component ThiW n=1 Tax=Cytobacillus firmus TaxID=1399 RepID=UPI0018CF3798|nr:energy coupling factor transporter S component ThiW [Cytobacillus firmus]MBG9585823.1 thiamine biosynthesis protein ThiW [Cytobacillus firmus]
MNRTRLLTTMALFTAIGTLGSHLLWFPAGIAKAYPVQHAVNVLAAVTLGPLPAAAVAFMIALLRNMLGFGTLLAFPGGMIGAFLAGVLYLKFGRKIWAAAGEVLGTGIIGALFAVPYAKFLMGSANGAFFFVPPFLVSSIAGAAIGWLVLAKVNEKNLVQNM